MKSNAPWSVKGIERDARETAKEAARREGMTVGEWLNQMIYSQSEGGATGALADAEVEGLKLRDIVTAIEHLRNRVVEADSKHAAAISDLTRNMGGFVERVQRLERVKPTEGSYQDVAQRLEKLERAGGDRHRIEALKALEKAVAQVAIQFNNAQRTTLTRLDSAEQQLQEFAERIDRVGEDGTGDAELGPLKTAIDGLAERVARAERIAEEATSLKTAAAESSDPEFVERTGARLRVLGDEIKRGGDQIRALEGTITKLSGQIEAAEKRSADGVQKVAETIAEVRTQLLAEDERSGDNPDVESILAAARAETEEKLDTLQRSLAEINARFEELSQTAAAAPLIQNQTGDAETNEEQASAEQIGDNETAAAIEDIESAIAAAQKIQDDETDAADDNFDEIDEAVAAIETGDAPIEDDPFAFADDFDNDPEEASADLSADERDAEDFSFQLDDENGESGDDDITVTTEDEDNTQLSGAQALLAEVRNALSGTGSPAADDDEDAEVVFEDPKTAQDCEDQDDEQAPNTASLGADISGAADQAEVAPAAPAAPPAAPKEDMMQAARRRAREAAASQAEEKARPRRAQLSAKQRAILAARARQKRLEREAAPDSADDAATDQSPSKTSASSNQPQPILENEDKEADNEPSAGRFSKITAALSAARAKLGRNNKPGRNDSETEADANPEFASAAAELEETAQRNSDRAALDTLRSTTSARPLTIALGAAIILAIAALAYLVKDFVFKPDAGSTTPTPVAQTSQPAVETTPESQANLPAVPEAPSIDPQALYIDSIDALAAAGNEPAAQAAIGKLQDAAALGYPPAQLQLGELYKTGQGVEQDLGQARVWFRRAANGGNVLAMHRIGVMTARGDGGPADSQEAIAWFEQAANLGLVDSQYNLGAIFHPSDDRASSAQDAGKAYYWYSLAARNGDDQAEPLAAGVAVALSPEDRAAIDARVTAWTAKPADESANLNASAG